MRTVKGHKALTNPVMCISKDSQRHSSLHDSNSGIRFVAGVVILPNILSMGKALTPYADRLEGVRAN